MSRGRFGRVSFFTHPCRQFALSTVVPETALRSKGKEEGAFLKKHILETTRNRDVKTHSGEA